MPYIDPLIRDDINEDAEIVFRNCKFYTYGELNYLITKILLNTEPECYTDFNNLIGVLESVKLELYRRVVSEYEDRKRIKNGDVYNG